MDRIQDALDGSVAIIVADDEGRYQAVNDAACVLFGRSHESMLALQVEQVTDPAVARATREVWQRFLAIGHMAGTFEIAQPDAMLCLVDFEAVADTPLPGHHVSRLSRSAIPPSVIEEVAAVRPLVRESSGAASRPGARGRRRERESVASVRPIGESA